jgi:hypothetical protein
MHTVIVPLERLPVPLPRLHVHVVEILHVFHHVAYWHNDLVRLGRKRWRWSGGYVERWAGDGVIFVVAVDVEVDAWVTGFVCTGELDAHRRDGGAGAGDVDIEAGDEVLEVKVSIPISFESILSMLY